MLKYVNFLATLFILLSCSNNQKDINLQKTLKTDTAAKSNADIILLGEPGIIDSSGIIAYPLILNKSYYNSYGSSSELREETGNYWNYLFYNSKTSQQHLLTNSKILFFSLQSENEYASKADQKYMEAFNHIILYLAAAKDYNADSILDGHDPVYLFVSDKQGYNFRQLSPNDFNVTSWKPVPGTTKIILEAQKDENGDKRFNNYDKTTILIVDILQNNVATETFSKAYIDTLKQTLIKIWSK